MRFKSDKQSGFQVFAVAGVNTVSFAIEATKAAQKGLLGFGVERADPAEDERYAIPGFKVFRSVVPHPTKDTRASTFEHPIQSFVWDDFTAKPGRRYTYFFHPIKGKPKKLDRRAPISIAIETEPLYSTLEHDVFFNRGVASSQAYSLRFRNLKPDKIVDPVERKKALQWLSRDLDDALLRFLRQAKAGDQLLGCFYEFRYAPIVEAFAAASERGVDVRLILDGKVNESTDKKGVFHPSFPREENRAAVTAAGIPEGNVTWREAKTNDIQHNKFVVLRKGTARKPTSVWTGSTNLSEGGIHGQTNVGHWLRDAAVAERYVAYWELLESDPGGRDGDDTATARAKNDAFKREVEALVEVPTRLEEVATGVTPIFSPRRGLDLLDFYVSLLDSAASCGCITLAFGIGKQFKQALEDNTAADQLTLMLLEKADRPKANSTNAFVVINAKNNVYKAWGSYLEDPLYQWIRETNARSLRLNQHVAYVHSKFLLVDPLGPDPIVVTGSANFSDASTNANDENMLVIRGDRRVADIYFTEFNRLWNHYYFRSVQQATRGKQPASATEDNLFLTESDRWLAKYAPGKLRAKRRAIYSSMAGAKKG